MYDGKRLTQPNRPGRQIRTTFERADAVFPRLVVSVAAARNIGGSGKPVQKAGLHRLLDRETKKSGHALRDILGLKHAIRQQQRSVNNTRHHRPNMLDLPLDRVEFFLTQALRGDIAHNRDQLQARRVFLSGDDHAAGGNPDNTAIRSLDTEFRSPHKA